MNSNEYQKRAMRFLNPALEEKDVLVNGVMGLCGESGEVIDLVKKHLHQGHPLDKKKMIDELGDVCWYIAELATSLGVDFEMILEENITKLEQRYPQGFSVEDSIHRKENNEN